ncbi:MAG: type II secretion system GspH family protein [bacterium]|nr:type II secretion system GspH family protein [bacterium]
MKKGFTIVELVVVFLIISCVTFFAVPAIIDNTRQAKLIVEWDQKFSDFSYLISAVRARSEITNTVYSKEAFFEHLKEQMRVVSSIDKKYTVKYKNNKSILETSKYYIKDYYEGEDGKFVGFKWVNKNCQNTELCAILQVDVNGLEPPNKLGIDVFGVDISKKDITPYGKGQSNELLKSDCSSKGTGAYCSYYYLIGGNFD